MLEFAWPGIFLLAPVPWLLNRWLPPAPVCNSALRIHFLAELENLTGQSAQPRVSVWRRQIPLIAIWILLLLAAARPQQLGAPAPALSSGRDLLLAVDLSDSMDTPDILQTDGTHCSRLEQVKQLLGPFIESRQGDRLGLILFGSQAYVQAPLTFDRRTVHQWMMEARLGLAGPNTALGDAIGLAIKRLRHTPAKGRVLILVTDGANNSGSVDPKTAARLAAEQGIKIYTLGLGNNEPTQTLPESDPLDEPLLKNIAQQTGGQYLHIAPNSQALESITQRLNQLEPITHELAPQRKVRPLYFWPLAIAALAVLFRMALRLWPPSYHTQPPPVGRST